MTINAGAVGATSGPTPARWTSTDCILYALGVGAGMTDPYGRENPFLTENSPVSEQLVLPTFACVAPEKLDSILSNLGPYNKAMQVHGAEEIELHRPLPAECSITTVSTIAAVYDKGSAAVVVIDSISSEAGSREPLFTIRATAFIQGEGGFGGPRGPKSGFQIPERAPDHRVTYHTRPDQALLYRLNGDRNPLHSNVQFAVNAGFGAPILHGLCSYGFTGRALLNTLCHSDPSRFRRMSGRFTKPVYPGDLLMISIWETGDGTAYFRTTTQRGEVVIDAGQCVYDQ